MMTDKEIVAVVTAHMAGKKIELAGNHGTAWIPSNAPCWNFSFYVYRVAPKQKRTITLYQWLCKTEGSEYWVSAHVNYDPQYGAIRRLDETAMTVEIDDE